MELRGANAIVTGASRGIGVYIARALAEHGVNLVLSARSAAELEAVRAEMAGLGVNAVAITGDIADATERSALVERSHSEIGPIDIVVNNAGIETVGQFHTAAEDHLARVLDVNLMAPMLLTRALLPGMIERGRGHVVNISSGAGKARRGEGAVVRRPLDARASGQGGCELHQAQSFRRARQRSTCASTRGADERRPRHRAGADAALRLHAHVRARRRVRATSRFR